MPNIKDLAKEYEPQQTLNIADLDVVDVDIDVKVETDVEYPYKYIEVDGKRYRLPTTVIKSLKAILAENPELKKFRVKKDGEGLKTTYTVIPLV